MKAPITLFTYNRVEHTRATINALQKNKYADESDLWIFSDAAADEKNEGSVDQVRKYLRNVTGFRKTEVIERKTNFGLGNSIIDGVTHIVKEYGKIIVLEDDLITSPYFLKFMNDGLEVYENNDQVASIHGYVYPVSEKLDETFFLKGADCWGWGTWKRSWDRFEPNGSLLLEKLMTSQQTHDFDYKGSYPYTKMLQDQINGKNSSWAVRWYASAFLNNLYTLYPGRSLVLHAGGDGSGTNTGYDKLLDVSLTTEPINVVKKEVIQNDAAFREFSKVLRKINKPSLLYRLKRKWNKMNN